MHCPSCGLPLAVDPARKGEAKELICGECGARIEYASYPGKGDSPPAAGPGDSEPTVCQPKKVGATTLFQPALMLESILTEDDDGQQAPAGTAAGLPPTAAVAPPLDLDVDVYFLVLGAPPGQERLPLKQARTVLGREEVDLVIDDPAVSARHCQIDVMGKEFYVRDLGSRNGTLLNGHPVRYSELLPGDELRLGDTVLVFRTSKDGLSDRP
jgi:hypothetical protein